MTEQSPAEAIFFAALEKGTAHERVAYLNAACGDDSNLRRRVERLLAAHPQVGSFLEAPAQAAVDLAEGPTIAPAEKGPLAPLAGTSSYHGLSEAAGAVIGGRYKLVEKIGEGGMGAVWVAQQTEPVKRVVAVKLIKAGMDSKAVLARFEAERQALALMDHPNISRVLDGGATPDGRPFFVMELVKGLPITSFCDARKLTPRQRLELFVPVCHAIQHAHQKGVIHRDIKPSNILIALYDDRPVPKVIDFGVAKATGQVLTDKSLMTGFGTVVGTPEYMSPEQASLNNLDIDTRSDVYSLGVLLYELLAGSPPFRGEELQQAGLFEMLRIVCEEEPLRPSLKLSTANKLASISADRGTEPKKLTGLLRNELDWIVMKALEKDRARRYETVNGFAADVQRYLAGEAVHAHPPSTVYRLRKFARKNRAILITAAAFAALLVAAAAVSGWLAVKATRAEGLANENAAAARSAEKTAEEKRREALFNLDEVKRARIETVVEKLKSDLNGLGLQVDLDLMEFKSDPRVGLLRLARFKKGRDRPVPITGIDENGEVIAGPFTLGVETLPEYGPLREFVTAAVLATCQRYAPLLPPITHDGQAVVMASLSPDNQTLLTLGKDYTVRLWDARTARPIGILRKGDERVVNCGFSPDGRTAFTDDQTSVARFWDVPSGRFRTATEVRPNRYVVADKLLFVGGPVPAAQTSDSRLLTRRFVGTKSPMGGGNSRSGSWEGLVELWDTATGRRIARLDVPGHALDWVQFLGKRWLTTLDGNTVLVFSAEDGRLLARLAHSAGELPGVDVGPSGRSVATVAEKPGGGICFRVWDVETWQVQSVTTVPGSVGGWMGFRNRYWMDDAFGDGGSIIALGWDGGWTVYRTGRGEPIAEFAGATSWPEHLGRAGDLAHGGNGWVYDTRTWRRLFPPPERKFHPDLARFAPDGRFVQAAINGELVVIDTRTDKFFPECSEWGYLPKFAMIAATSGESGATVRLIPSASGLNIPADLLELWAQVAVRGHLNDEGAFAKWDEPTWEKKRQELAAKPAPYPDFPFPGHVATDKLHWLRQEYESASDADKPRLARQLLDRALAIGDKAEAVRWRAVLGADADYPPQ